ncbi:neutral zinc metallopeptidase [Kribbella sp. CA-294648]|uniref:neutral zinc metallopeptidase n=1 Tax=Kribbella sp. CA-294648 TaxID=3239948 RepID=UPI003D8E1AE2
MIARGPRRKTERGALRFGLLIVVAALVVAIAFASRQRQADDSGDMSLGRTSGPAQGVSDAAQRSLVDYWEGELPKVYDRQFVPPAGGFQPKTPESPPFSCGGERLTYQDLQGNAVYCGAPEDDYIAWDAAGLFPRLVERFGSVAPAIVLAHETGHAVQARAGVDAPSVVRELQADCFAGSWTRWSEGSATDAVSFTDGALDSAVATILTLRDQPGTPAGAQQAHGLGFDRVNAFQTGYEQGAEACAGFPERGVVTTELPFRTVAESQTGGNLPYPEAVAVLTDSLNDFWTSALPQLKPGTTFDPPAVRPGEGDRLQGVHEQIGDLATGAILSEAWAEAAQTAAELPTAGRQAGMQRDCFTGAWLAYLAGDDLASSQLSPGDLDEALTQIVLSSFADDGHRIDRGGAFERTRALRTGLFGNLPSCR